VKFSPRTSLCIENKLKLSYRKQIARQLRIQYVGGIYRPKYYTVTLESVKVTGNGTIGWIRHDLLLVELLDVEYYRDREMWVRDIKVMPSESLGTVSHSPSIVIVAVSLAILEIFSVKEWPDLEIWVWSHSRLLKMARFHKPCMTISPPL